MNPLGVFSNNILVAALSAWWLSQSAKVPLTYFKTRRWDWSLLFRISPGGMPSAHSAMVAAAAHAVGLYIGYNTATFATAFVLAVIVIYDARGVRLQAGKHARIINLMTPERDEPLQEVIGHTPKEAFVGVLVGIATAQFVWFVRR